MLGDCSACKLFVFFKRLELNLKKHFLMDFRLSKPKKKGKKTAAKVNSRFSEIFMSTLASCWADSTKLKIEFFFGFEFFIFKMLTIVAVLVLVLFVNANNLPTIRILWRESSRCEEFVKMVQKYPNATVVVDCVSPPYNYYSKELRSLSHNP